MIRHTPGPWELIVNDRWPFTQAVEDKTKKLGVGIDMYHYSTVDKNLEDVFARNPQNKIRFADAELIALAPTAPHECDDPKCPGNINRRKLELYPEMMAIINDINNGWGVQESIARRMISGIVKAEAIEKGV